VGKSVVARKSWAQTVEDHARTSAKNKGKIYHCPYPKPPHRTVWIREFAKHSQLRLI